VDAQIVASSEDTQEWMELGNISDFTEGTVSQAKLPSGFPIAIYLVDGEFYATSDRCTHGAASLSDEGELEGHVIECAWHYGTFDIRTGAALTLPCRASLPTFNTRIEGDLLLVKMKPNKRFRPEQEESDN
jgi:p-cumate 2,3-dioxygenase ferredoxin component